MNPQYKDALVWHHTDVSAYLNIGTYLKKENDNTIPRIEVITSMISEKIKFLRIITTLGIYIAKAPICGAVFDKRHKCIHITTFNDERPLIGMSYSTGMDFSNRREGKLLLQKLVPFIMPPSQDL